MRCGECKNKIDKNMDFCPECGSQIAVANNSYKKLFTILGICLAIILLAYFVSKTILIQNQANSAKAAPINTDNTDTLGNLPGNITCGGYYVANNDAHYTASNNGIFKFNKNSNPECVYNNKSCGLNIYNNYLYFIDAQANEIIELNIENTETQTIVKQTDGSKITDLAIYKSSLIYVAQIKNLKKVYICSQEGKNTKELGSFDCKCAYFTCLDGVIKLCMSNPDGWCIYEGDLSSQSENIFKERLSGSMEFVDMAFDNDSIYYLVPNGNHTKLFFQDYSGNRKEYTLDMKIEKIILNKEVALVYGDNKFYSFKKSNVLTNDITNKLLLQDSRFVSFMIDDNQVGVVYDNGNCVSFNTEKQSSTEFVV